MNYDQSYKLNKQDRLAQQKARLDRDTGGSGVFLFENNTNAEIILPKPALDGNKRVKAHKQFEGDDYFLKQMGPPNHLPIKLIAEISPRTPQVQPAQTLINEVDMRTEKLILDQPDTVSDEGKVEHTRQVPTGGKNRTITETPVVNKPAQGGDRLILEDPLDGVQILSD